MRKNLLWLFLLVFTLPALAQEPPPPPELDGDIVLEGLNGPQGLFIDAEGALWVVDSGVGGSEEVEFFDPATFELNPATLGSSSRILRWVPGGEAEVIASLPSVAVGTDFIGAARVTALDGVVYATVGAWHIAGGETVTLPMQAQVVRIEDGEPVMVADLWQHELLNNPDGTTNLESHPYGIIGGADGLLYVADAAGNTLLSVNPATGEVETLAVFEGLPGVFPSPWRDNEPITDPVPTAVVQDENGDFYVSLLSGAPFIPGSAKVLKVSGGEITDFALGMTMLTDLKQGPDGNLYATSFGMFTEEGPVFNSGAILRILPDGSVETLVSGLPFATALAVDAEGNGYVAINGIAIPDAGMIVYYEGLTGMEGEPVAPMSS